MVLFFYLIVLKHYFCIFCMIVSSFYVVLVQQLAYIVVNDMLHQCNSEFKINMFKMSCIIYEAMMRNTLLYLRFTSNIRCICTKYQNQISITNTSLSVIQYQNWYRNGWYHKICLAFNKCIQQSTFSDLKNKVLVQPNKIKVRLYILNYLQRQIFVYHCKYILFTIRVNC